MMVDATKKTILLLSIILLHGSMFGMLDEFQKKMSLFVISQKRQVATAALVPLAAAGCYVLAQHTKEISSLFEKIPMPSEKLVLGLATAAAMPATYVLAGKFSPEEQFQLYHHNYAEIKNHLIMKNREILEQFIAGKQQVQLKEKTITLSRFIHNNFSDEVDAGLWANIKIGNELCVLKRRINVEYQRLNRIKDAGINWDIVEQGKDKFSVETPSQGLDQLRKDSLFIDELLGMIGESSGHKDDRKDCPAIKKNQLTQEQITFSSKIAAFVPMFTQPVSSLCMAFLGILFAKFGIELQYESY